MIQKLLLNDWHLKHNNSSIYEFRCFNRLSYCKNTKDILKTFTAQFKKLGLKAFDMKYSEYLKTQPVLSKFDIFIF